MVCCSLPHPLSSAHQMRLQQPASHTHQQLTAPLVIQMRAAGMQSRGCLLKAKSYSHLSQVCQLSLLAAKKTQQHQSAISAVRSVLLLNSKRVNIRSHLDYGLTASQEQGNLKCLQLRPGSKPSASSSSSMIWILFHAALLCRPVLPSQGQVSDHRQTLQGRQWRQVS